ncbi:MAG: hypothetical protein ACYC06_06570 [Ilumatobacteraceae bacterium]
MTARRYSPGAIARLMNISREEVLEMVADNRLRSVDVYGVPYIVEQDANALAEMRWAARPVDTSLISYRFVAERIGREPSEVLLQMFEGDIPYVCHRGGVYMTPENFSILVQSYDRTRSEAGDNSDLADRLSVTKNR